MANETPTTTMSPLRRLRLPVLAAAAALLAALGGCQGAFTPKVRVIVDAISVTGGDNPAGKSYKLVARKSVVTSLAQVNVLVVSACVKAALNQRGMFEAPEKVAPDYFVEVTYGVDTAARADPMTRESFIQFSARANPDRNLERGRGAEIWDVRAAVLGLQGRFETALPLLATMAASYAGKDTHQQVPLSIPQNAPEVIFVREAAIRELDEKKQAEPAKAVAQPALR